MGIFSKTFRPNIIRDYGVISKHRMGISRMQTSLTLCEDNGVKFLRFRHKGTAPLAFSVSYHLVYEEDFDALKFAVDDAAATSLP